jgi:hypothetical protein
MKLIDSTASTETVIIMQLYLFSPGQIFLSVIVENFACDLFSDTNVSTENRLFLRSRANTLKSRGKGDLVDFRGKKETVFT